MTAASVWLGERWRAALASLGVTGLEVHSGGMEHTRWSHGSASPASGPARCWTASKLVGISQRRTRRAARFQCAAHVRWDPAALVGLLAAPRPSVGELPAVATISAQVGAALPAALDRRAVAGASGLRPPGQETLPAGTTHSTGWPVTAAMRSKSWS